MVFGILFFSSNSVSFPAYLGFIFLPSSKTCWIIQHFQPMIYPLYWKHDSRINRFGIPPYIYRICCLCHIVFVKQQWFENIVVSSYCGLFHLYNCNFLHLHNFYTACKQVPRKITYQYHFYKYMIYGPAKAKIPRAAIKCKQTTMDTLELVWKQIFVRGRLRRKMKMAGWDFNEKIYKYARCRGQKFCFNGQV